MDWRIWYRPVRRHHIHFSGDVVALLEDGPAIEPESDEDLYLTDPKNGDFGMFLGVPRIGNAL